MDVNEIFFKLESLAVKVTKLSTTSWAVTSYEYFEDFKFNIFFHLLSLLTSLVRPVIQLKTILDFA